MTAHFRRSWFWLLNGLLILLYLWTMGEETAVSIQVINGRCIANVPDRHIAIDCPEISQGSQVGLYTAQPGSYRTQLTHYAPLRWLAPHAGWRDLALFSADGQPLEQYTFHPIEWTQWQTHSGSWINHWGELSGKASQNSILLRQPMPQNFTFSSTLRRAENDAGLLLVTPNGQSGFIFIVNGATRRGVWWQWQNGRPTQPIIGIPFQKPALPQFQTLLRSLLIGQQAALLLLIIVWLIRKLLLQLPSRIKRQLSFLQQTLSQFFNHPLPEKTMVLGLILLTFAITSWVATDVLAGVPHVQDSLTYLFQAETLARGKLWAPAPPLPEFFKQEFLLVQNGRWFGKYPPGYPAVLAVGVLLQAPWLINPLLAALTVALLYQLGKRLYNGRMGLMAALLGTSSPFFIFLSSSQMAHAAELFWLTLFMLSWHKAINCIKGWHWAVTAGLAAGISFLTRQLTAVAITAPYFLILTFSSSLSWATRLKKKALWLTALLPLVGLLFVYQAAVTGNPLQDPRLLYWPYDQMGFGDDVGEAPNLLQISLLDKPPGYAIIWHTDPSQPPRGHTVPRGLQNIYRNWQLLQDDLFGWLPLFTFSFIWLLFAWQRPSATDWLLLLTAVTLIFAELFYWHSGIMYGPRYFYGSLPALLLLTARGIRALAQRQGRWPTAILLTILIGGNLFFYLPQRADSYRGFNFVVGDKVAQVDTAVSANEQALIFVETPTNNWWEYGELFLGNRPWLNGRLIFARDLGYQANRTLQTQYPNRTAYLLHEGNLIPLK